MVEIALINAAIEAGVKFFIPSEWAPDSAGSNVIDDPWIGRTLRPNVVIAPKRAVHNYLMARAGQGKIAFAVVFPGVIIPSSKYFFIFTIVLPFSGRDNIVMVSY
jgi:hypothetical protein